jgi:hypothetical protein
MPEVTIPNGFKARAYQVPYMRYFDKGGKRAVSVIHRRGDFVVGWGHKEERALHKQFKHLWVRGEWHRLEPDLVDHIRALVRAKRRGK